jgi:oxysterol-binding protein-related protein 9/10/11
VHYPSDDRTLPPIQHLFLLTPPTEDATSSLGALRTSESSSSKSKSKKYRAHNPNKFLPDPSLAAVEQNLAAGLSDLSLAASSDRSLIEKDSIKSDTSSVQERVRVLFLTEQISHHPPISAFHYYVPSRGVSAVGIDQISAKVSGTNVKISPGSSNKGIFVKIGDGNGKGEKYRITHPAASVNGLLSGKFYAAFCESTIVSIEGGENWRVIIEYKDEVGLLHGTNRN